MHDQFLALWMDSWKDEIEYRFPMSEHVLIDLHLAQELPPDSRVWRAEADRMLQL
jgi:hypothetical protein